MFHEVGNNDEYKDFISEILSLFKKLNKEARKEYGIKFNTELVPGESLGVKNAKWDAKDNLFHGKGEGRRVYNSYLYLPESDRTSIPDKFELHGGKIANSLDGGSALHLNLARLPGKEFFLWLRKLAAKHGTTYWTTNVKTTCCDDCGAHSADTLDTCPVCGSKNVQYATRVIGYCKRISSFSEDRQKEESQRFYH